MKHLRIFSKNFKNIIARHNAWDDSWGIDKWPSFNASTQLYIITDPIADINEAGQWVQPQSYSVQNSGYTFVDQSNLTREILSGLQGTGSNQTASLSWNAINGCNYRIFRDGVEIVFQSPNTYEESGLTNGQLYTYEIWPVNGYGTWGYPQTIQITPQA